MENVIQAKVRTELGRNAAKRYRKKGFIPVIFYGKGENTIPAVIKKSELLRFLHQTHGESVVFTVDIEGERKMAILKDLQLDPITDDVIHADFLLLHKGEEVEIEVPVVLVGVENAPATRAGAIIEQLVDTLWIKAQPQNIPPHIEIDVSGMEVGDVLHVRDIKAENFTINEDPDMPIVTVLTERAAGPEEGEEAEEQPEEGTTGSAEG